MEKNRITVAKYEPADCISIGDAFAKAMAMEGHVDIYIKDGIYDEKLVLERDDVTIIGESTNNTVITYDDYAKKLDEDGNPLETFRTATLKICGNDIKIKNLSVVNRSGNGRDFGQAVALFTDGDRMEFYNLKLLAAQDTLFVGPQPECKNNQEDTLPAEDTKVVARQYFKNCYIRGDIDFIFGGATAYFDQCEIFSQYNITEDDEKTKNSMKGYVAAACTYRGQKHGFVFHQCKFTSDCKKETIYLARPWRIYAKTVFVECELGEHIHREVFHDWDKEKSHNASFYGLCNCTNFGKKALCDWAHEIKPDRAGEYDIANVLGNFIPKE